MSVSLLVYGARRLSPIRGTMIWIAALLATLLAVRAQTQISGTLAGRALEAWLKSFNSADPEEISNFHKRFDPQDATGFMVIMREQTGGFDFVAVEQNEPLQVTFVVREKRGNRNRARGTLRLHDSEIGAIVAFELFVIPASSPATQPLLDRSARARVIDAVIARLEESYVFPDVANRMADILRQHVNRGEYDQVTDQQAFADLLTTDLQAVSKDKHLRVRFLNVPLMPPTTNDPAIGRGKQLQAINCGFEKAERLPTNIGYLKLNLFADPGLCGTTATAAMQFIADTDSVILDLRDNGGGEPEMVAYLSSYLFPGPIHLNDLWNRANSTTRQYWTLPYVPGTRLSDKPVFVLTSSRTFSAAEEFAYNLQALKRASIVGETTGGGAHPVSGFPLVDRFIINVPVARAVNPVTGKNWEGTGVQPDVKCSPADALMTAERLALAGRMRPQ